MKTGRARHSKLRAAIALLASYALALQMLLATVIVTQHAAFAAGNPEFTSIICFGASSTDAPVPDHGKPAAQPTTCVLCLSFAGSAAILPDNAICISALGTGDAFARYPLASLILAARPTPKLAQGPPLAA